MWSEHEAHLILCIHWLPRWLQNRPCLPILWASALAVPDAVSLGHAVERRDDGHAEESDNTARFRNQLQSLMIRWPQSLSDQHGCCEWQPFAND